jgi:hypothetical protein
VVVGTFDFLARYGASGDLDWRIENDDVHFSLLDTTADDGIFVVGEFNGTVTLGQGEANETTLDNQTPVDGFFIARYNSDGTLAFARVEAGDSGMDNGVVPPSFGSMAAVGDGGFVWAGGFFASATLGWGGADEQELVAPHDGQFIARYDSIGELMWVSMGWYDGMYSIWGVDGFDDGSSVFAATSRGNTVLAYGQPDEIEINTGMTESMILARYEEDGTLAWVHAGAFSVDRDGAVAASQDGDSIFTAGFYGVATFGFDDSEQVTLDSGEGTIFIAKYAK